MDSDSEPESKLFSLICQLYSLSEDWELEWYLHIYMNPDFNWKFISCIIQIISLVSSMDLDSQPKPESELMSLISQTISIFNSMDLDSLPGPLRNLISLISQHYISLINSIYSDLEPNRYMDRECMDVLDETSSLQPKLKLISGKGHIHVRIVFLVIDTLSVEPQPKLISLIHQIFSLVNSKISKLRKLTSVCTRTQVTFKEGKIHVIEEVSRPANNMFMCLPFNWRKFRLYGGEGYTHFLCEGCNGENHKEYNKTPLEIKHPLHPKHFLQLVLFRGNLGTRECYCCEKNIEGIFYCCSACDYAITFNCAEKAPVLSKYHPKWHRHTLVLFPSQASLPCSVCALTHSSCPLYICPPCDFVVHQRCFSLPRVIRISRHQHRICFTPSFVQGNWFCGVCRRKINNDYGSYSCTKDGCSYVAHSRCATQSNVWDGVELEGEPEEVEEEEIEPFVTISDGIIHHFTHQLHHLRLDDNTSKDYDENRLCQACITPIYIGNFYSCMQCKFILHEECANLPRKIHHPIHPHLLTLVHGYDGVMDYVMDTCSACSSFCKAGFFYECSKEGCCFMLHVKCAIISEPLVHPSHRHPLFLTSKPGEKRRSCSICKDSRHYSTNETFNCIECDYFALCFKCATLPHKVRYKHDKHMLTLSYGDETSTTTYWCEVCEGKINPKERFYMCDEYCCVRLHIECMLGVDFFLKPGILLRLDDMDMDVLSNNHHMSRPICFYCKKRCPHKIALHWGGFIFCSTSCIVDYEVSWLLDGFQMEF